MVRNCLRLLLIAVSLLAGCQYAPVRQQGLLEQKIADSRLSSLQLRRLVDDYVVRFVHEVETGADHILDETDDPQIRRNAILWKSNAISACLRAGSRSDALGAYLDVALLTLQMRRLFESPEAANLFGPYQRIAVSVALDLDKPLLDIEHALGISQPLNDDLVQKLAVEYPIRDLSFDRESLTARYVDLITGSSHQIREVVSGLEESVADARRLAVLYAEILPKQARWQAELALLDAVGSKPLASVLHDVHAVTDLAGRMAELSERLPGIAMQERTEVERFTNSARLAITHDVDAMRRDSQKFLNDERALLVADLREERLAATRDLHAEIAETTRRAEHMVDRVRDDLVLQSNQLVSRVLNTAKDALQFAALSLIVVAALTVLVVRRRHSIYKGDNDTKPPGAIRVIRPAA